MKGKKLVKMIEDDESETLEFKKSTGQLEKALKTVCGFLNHKGGRVYFGVDNRKVVGQDVSDQTLKSVSQKIRQRIKPEISPEIRVLGVEGKKIVEVKVKEGDNKPYYLDGVAYKRVGTENVVIPPEELERIILEKKKSYWDSRICEEARLKDVDEEKVRWFLRKAKYERNFDVEKEAPVKEVLERLELIKDGKLTNAAVLLFGKNPQKFFLQAESRCARFKGTKPIKPFIDMKVFSGNIIDQVDKSLSFVLEHVPMKVYLTGKPAREEKYEYPPDAIREAIINAICHRDYETSTNIQIRIFDDRIEVWGCGPLPEPLTPEDLREKHRSILRNPLIAKCFFLMKFIEQWGTGTNDMIDMCLNEGIPEPLFEYVTGDFVVTFRKSKLTEEYLEELDLNERQKTAVMVVKEEGKITNKKYQDINSVSRQTATRELSGLVQKGVFKQVGITGKGTFYILTPNAS